MTQPIPYPEYPASALQPLFWQGLVDVMVDIVILVALASWALSQAKKAWRGEEIEKPF